MKRAPWLLLLLPVLALFGAMRWKTHQPEYLLRQFSAQQKARLRTRDCAAEHLDTLKRWQASRKFPRVAPDSYASYNLTVIWLSWYYDKYTPVQWSVDTRGELREYWRIWDHAVYHAQPKGLSTQINSLPSLLARFPSSITPAPDLENVLFASYRDGNSWLVRIYDQRYLPSSVREVLKLISARAETTKRHKGYKPDLTR